MPSRTALGAAAGLALTAAGGATALFLTIGPAASTSSASDGTSADFGTSGSEVVVEYVDQYGNPVDPSALGSAPAQAIVPATLDRSAEYDDDEYDDDAGYDDEYDDAEYDDDGYEHEEYDDDDD